MHVCWHAYRFYRCVHHLSWACFAKTITMTNSILEHLERPSTFVKIAFIDFSSAFNTIQPHLLVGKLAELGVNQKLINWINSFLTNRTQQVRFNSVTSTSRPINTGAPSGVCFVLMSAELVHPHILFSNMWMILPLWGIWNLIPDLTSFEEEVSNFTKWCKDNFRNGHWF